MSVREQVLAAKTPRDALLVLADAIDQIVNQPQDLWAEWDLDECRDTYADKSKDDRITEIREQLNAGVDEEDARALAAELKLLLDDGKALEDTGVTEGERPIVERTGDGIVVNLPEPSEAQEVMRTSFVDEVLSKDKEWKDYTDSFVKGGPLLLYYTNRDYVMQLPTKWRQLFVQDVQINSPAEARELGRDILKVEDDEMDPSLKIEQFSQTHGD